MFIGYYYSASSDSTHFHHSDTSHGNSFTSNSSMSSFILPDFYFPLSFIDCIRMLKMCIDLWGLVIQLSLNEDAFNDPLLIVSDFSLS